MRHGTVKFSPGICGIAAERMSLRWNLFNTSEGIRILYLALEISEIENCQVGKITKEIQVGLSEGFCHQGYYDDVTVGGDLSYAIVMGSVLVAAGCGCRHMFSFQGEY
jgi:hypothetical protein